MSALGESWKLQKLEGGGGHGPMGLGATRSAEDLRQAVIEELVRRAGLARKNKGKMQIDLLGKDYEVRVEEYDSFGESAFNLTLKECKRKSGK